MTQEDVPAWLESRHASKFLGQPVDLVFRVDLLGRMPSRAVVEFRGFLGGSNSGPTPLEKFDELAQVIAVFLRSKALLGTDNPAIHQLLKADLGSIEVVCAKHKILTVIIKHCGGTVQRELTSDLAKEITEFTDHVRTCLTKVEK